MKLDNSIFALLFDSIQEGLIVVDSTSTIVLANQVCLNLFGYKPGELLGEKIEILIPTSKQEKHKEHRNNYQREPKKRTMGSTLSLNGKRKDGSEFPVQVGLNPFVDQEEKYVAALVSDVTEKRKAEEELIRLNQTLEEKVVERTAELFQSEQLYRSIARNFPSGVISIFDDHLNYLFAEGQGLYELGIETSDLIGLNYLERIAESARKKVQDELYQVFRGKARDFEVNVNQATYLINAVPLRNSVGKIDRILVVEKNITAQKEIKDRLEENLETEKALNEMKSRFVSMASHEFRTPLTTINSSASLISKYHEKGQYEQTNKHVHRIKGAVANLTNILNDFLSLEKLESGKIQKQESAINIVEMLTELSDEMGGLIKKGQQIKVSCTDTSEIYSDKNLLKNILLNLVSNALKYSPEDSLVGINCSVSNKMVQISVKDNGIGIPEKDKEQMFERFFRAGNALNIEGTGLGLNIVTKYIELLNGTIHFESEEGKGSTFTISLPNEKNEESRRD